MEYLEITRANFNFNTLSSLTTTLYQAYRRFNPIASVAEKNIYSLLNSLISSADNSLKPDEAQHA